MTHLPCLASVDVCVVGGSSAGVAAAIAASRAGARTAILAERTYLGDDIGGAFGLWAGSDPVHALARRIWTQAPCTPLHAKEVLEQAAIAAGVELLYATGPTHVLRDRSDRICGIAIATAGGPLAVAARVLVDATRHRLVGRICGFAAQHGGIRRLDIAVIGERPVGAEALGTIIAGSRWGAARTVDVWMATRQVDLGDGSPLRWAGADVALRDAVFTPGQLRIADLLVDHDATSEPAWPADSVAIAAGDELPPAGRLAAGDVLGIEAAARARRLATPAPVQATAAGAQPVPGLRWLPTAARFNHLPVLDLPGLDALPAFGSWDVLVLGGGTGGAPAGIAAARTGVRTLVAEAAPGLGGVGTQGMIGTYWDGNRVGFTRAIDRGVAAMGPGGDPDSGSWNVEWKAAWYLRQLLDVKADVCLGAHGVACICGGNRINGAALTTPWGAGTVHCSVAVDASGCATLPAAAGCPTTAIGADHVAVQGTGLSPRELGTSCRNSDWTFVDDTDPVDVTRAFAAARRKWTGEFDVAQLVDSRERRQIVSELDLGVSDILARRTFPDTVCTARSSFDTHGFTVHPVFMIEPPLERHGSYTAHIPLRSLLPHGLEGVLVTGLGMGAHRDALPVVRMQPDVQNAGWAAGLCAAWAARDHGGTIRAVPVRRLQQALVEQGNLDPSVTVHEDSFPTPAATIRAAIYDGLPDHHSLALIFAESERARPLLHAALAETSDPTRRERMAQALGLVGDTAGTEVLAEAVRSRSWDSGWNYRGMGQFGRSMSHVDGLLVALGRTADRRAVPLVAAKLDELGLDCAFSHVRAAAIAATALGDAILVCPLARLLSLPGIGGHVQENLGVMIGQTDEDGCATSDRNAGLRELALARALWQLGDHEGLGGRTLRGFAGDLRGAFARHARAILAEPAGAALHWDQARRQALA